MTGPGASHVAPSARDWTRVVVWNVGDAARDTGEVLRVVHPTIALLPTAGPKGALKRAAAKAGLEVAVHAGSRRTASAVLVRPDVRVLTVREVALDDPDGAERTAVVAILGMGDGRRFAATATQFAPGPTAREVNRRQTMDLLDATDAVPLLGCDPNEGPAGDSAQRLATDLRDAWTAAGEGFGATYPNPEPTARRTFLFIGAPVRVGTAEVAAFDAARHAGAFRPLVVEVH